MGLKSDQHTCSLPTCPSLNCSFYFSPHLRKQDARFFFFFPLPTLYFSALGSAYGDDRAIQTSSPAKTALFSGVDGRLWSAELSACQAAEERKEKLVVLSLPAASFHPLPGIHTVHRADSGPGPPPRFPPFACSSRRQRATAPPPPKKKTQPTTTP